MKIFRAVIEVIVMLEGDSAEAAKANLEQMSLDEIDHEMMEGEFVGSCQTRVAAIREVPPEDVAMEERALGSDGTFFASLEAS